jgi:hypothetical protein
LVRFPCDSWPHFYCLATLEVMQLASWLHALLPGVSSYVAHCKGTIQTLNVRSCTSKL